MLDGNKRLRTLITFMNNELVLDNGMYFRDLEFWMQNRLEHYEIVAHVINPAGDPTGIITKFITEKMEDQEIQWRTYKGEAGDLQTLLIGEINGIRFSCLYNDFSWFNWSMKRAKRKITKAINLMDK